MTQTTAEALSASVSAHSTIHKISIRGASSSFKINFIVVHVLSGFIVSGDGHGGKDAEYLLNP